MPDYTKLFFDSVTLLATSTTVTPQPHFKCPNCSFIWTYNTALPAPINQTTDFNSKVAFKCPSCASTITLFMAVHRDATSEAKLCLQKSSEEGAGGIPPTWWQ